MMWSEVPSKAEPWEQDPGQKNRVPKRISLDIESHRRCKFDILC